MIENAPPNRPGDVVGVIRHRLLINRWVDPDEVAPMLPEGVRPFVGSGGGVVVGCCLIAIEAARPWPLPAVGPTLRAAAHRISAEVGSPDSATRAVYVPMRHTDSRSTVALGGRMFPGAHRRSAVDVRRTDKNLDWDVKPLDAHDSHDGVGGFGIAASATLANAEPATSEVAEIVIGTVRGLSPNHRGRLEAADMLLASRAAQRVELDELRSSFLDGFASAEEAETLLMTDVGVTWRRAAPDQPPPQGDR